MVKSLEDVKSGKEPKGSLVVFRHIRDTPLTFYKNTPLQKCDSQKSEKKQELATNLNSPEIEGAQSIDMLTVFLPDTVNDTLGTDGLTDFQSVLSGQHLYPHII